LRDPRELRVAAGTRAPGNKNVDLAAMPDGVLAHPDRMVREIDRVVQPGARQIW
jgi:hypothetical protein